MGRSSCAPRRNSLWESRLFGSGEIRPLAEWTTWWRQSLGTAHTASQLTHSAAYWVTKLQGVSFVTDPPGRVDVTARAMPRGPGPCIGVEGTLSLDAQ